ncbi:RNA recognition domain-containing protein [Xylariales sp. AK1849]|nr:RNA recognition domain-containing protein [Xylariales sp. AK1849]
MAKQKASLAASKLVIDKTLNDLFASSSGPVKAPAPTRYSKLLPEKERNPIERLEAELASDEEEHVEDEEVLSEIEGDLSDAESQNSDQDEASSDEDKTPLEQILEPKKKDRKRKARDEYDDLEIKYLGRLADDDEDDEPTEKRRKGEVGQASNGETSEQPVESEDATIVHESLLQKTDEHPDVEVEKANRTLFLGNVSAEAINSSKAKKQLMAHLASPLSSLDSATGPHKVESLRFRSAPFAAGGMPKRAAYITKSVMTATTKSSNAYVVYSTSLAARVALKALNGTVILERHLRADSVAHPTPTDHRRCVFVGNLGFVDDETVVSTNAEGESTTKKRNKVPADVEEGLWRTFGKAAGKVESVRVPRDAKTRVGKGFAYVQFYDANDVESALLLEGKKFPPMLPRALRVSRAKDPRRTALAMERTVKAKLDAAGMNGSAGKPKSTKYKHKATPEQQSLAGRASRLLGRAGAARQQRGLKGEKLKPRRRDISNGVDGADMSAMKTPEQIVFEGRRASSRDAKPRDLKFNKGQGKGKKGPKGKPQGRGAKRASEWRKKGSK